MSGAPLPDVDGLFRLDGQAAILAGAAGPLGAALAQGLVTSGCALLVADRPAPALSALADDLRCAGGRVAVAAADPRDPSAAPALVARAVGAFGRLDGLVLAAGAGPADGPDAFAAALDESITARAALAGAAARTMIEAGGGWMVVVDEPRRDLASLAGAGGLAQLTRDLARQWAPRGIRVNGLSIGAGWAPADVDAPLVFLAASSARFVTGVTLTADGGAGTSG